MKWTFVFRSNPYIASRIKVTFWWISPSLSNLPFLLKCKTFTNIYIPSFIIRIQPNSPARSKGVQVRHKSIFPIRRYFRGTKKNWWSFWAALQSIWAAKDDRSSSERTHIFPDRHLSFENLLTGLFYRMIIMRRYKTTDLVRWAIRS